MAQTICNPLETIQNAGLRRTSPRVAVLSVLSDAKKPLSIKELARRPSLLKFDIVTIYRTIESFRKAGIAEQVVLSSGQAHYELKDADDHHHIVCTNCKRIEDFEDVEHERLAKRAVQKSHLFSQLTGHSFELYGLCNSCAVIRS